MKESPNISAFIDITCECLGVSKITQVEEIQRLWSGYGKILRYEYQDGSSNKTIIIKHVAPPKSGLESNISHQRKLKSYQVESAWYRNYSSNCDNHCRLPHPLLIKETDGETWMVLEDLDAAGFHLRKRHISVEEIKSCLKWLAHFHAKFMGSKPDGLWGTGTYWHLKTRPDELEVLDDLKLKNAAHAIDKTLNDATYQSFVHGDAKLANFCFSKDGDIATVDFQYVGGGCGMKDVAYFVGSCLDEGSCESLETELLDSYFGQLKDALDLYDKKADPNEVEAEWRALYDYAWTDFFRFIQGWSPGYLGRSSYSEKIARKIIKKINN